MKPLIHQLKFSPASDHGGVNFKLSLGAKDSENYHFKVHGELVDPESSRTVIYAFAGDYCIARICPRHEIVGLGKRLTGRRDGGMGHFVDWIPVFSLPGDFTIRLYADEMGKFNLSSTTHHGKGLGDAVYLGEITGGKSFINDSPADYIPLRLSCFGRSGSSLLMRYLSFHPQVAVAGRHPYEFTIASFYYNRCRLLSSNSQDFFADQLNQARRRHQNPWYQYEQVSWMGGDAETFFGREQVAREISHCRDSVDGFYRGVKPRSGDGKMFFCEKDGSGRAGHDEYCEVWPDAERLFLVRDFRDNCASILAYCARKGTREFGLQYFDNERDWLKTMASKARALLARYQAPENGSTFVFYEKLVTDESASLAEAFRALGLSADPAVVSSVIERSKALDASRAVGDHATSNSVEQSVGRWRQDLDKELCAVMEEEFSEVMAGFSYEV